MLQLLEFFYTTKPEFLKQGTLQNQGRTFRKQRFRSFYFYAKVCIFKQDSKKKSAPWKSSITFNPDAFELLYKML